MTPSSLLTSSQNRIITPPHVSERSEDARRSADCLAGFAG
jgi:hypothetical protein